MKGLQLKYFVLNPEKSTAYGYASRKAMLTYAEAIESVNYELAEDLREWVNAASERTTIPKEVMR